MQADRFVLYSRRHQCEFLSAPSAGWRRPSAAFVAATDVFTAAVALGSGLAIYTHWHGLNRADAAQTLFSGSVATLQAAHHGREVHDAVLLPTGDGAATAVTASEDGSIYATRQRCALATICMLHHALVNTMRHHNRIAIFLHTSALLHMQAPTKQSPLLSSVAICHTGSERFFRQLDAGGLPVGFALPLSRLLMQARRPGCGSGQVGSSCGWQCHPQHIDCAVAATFQRLRAGMLVAVHSRCQAGADGLEHHCCCHALPHGCTS